MRIVRNTYINAARNADGSQNVSGWYGPNTGWLPMGTLQGEVKAFVPEQPTNKWKAHMKARYAK